MNKTQPIPVIYMSQPEMSPEQPVAHLLEWEAQMKEICGISPEIGQSLVAGSECCSGGRSDRCDLDELI